MKFNIFPCDPGYDFPISAECGTHFLFKRGGDRLMMVQMNPAELKEFVAALNEYVANH